MLPLLHRSCIADIGNTRTKIAFMEGADLTHTLVFSTPDLADHLKELDSLELDAWIISSVAPAATPVLRHYLAARAKGLELQSTTPLPFSIHYSTPATLGNDRIAAIAGAYAQFSGVATLVIDAGTCIKYDILSDKGVFEGGTIAPGLRMRLRAMHTFTQALPLLPEAEGPWPETVAVTGNSTSGSMLSGAYAAALMEAEGMIAHYTQQFGNLKVMLTGGDAPFFASRLKSKIFAVPDLTLTGLQTILEYNFNNL